MITLSHISKSFSPDKQAVSDVSFEVQRGEIMVLLGTSGCGKTTTLRMINRLITPDSGQIHINGKDIAAEPAETLRRGIGYVLQNHGLFPHYTVLENISIVPQLLQWDKTRIKERALSLMEKLGLPPRDYANAYPQQLSGGQQQRVGLARALAADPPVLLMDEPFGALDPLTRISVRREFKALDELNSKTVILVTHDVEEAFDLGSRICIMDKGRIQQLGTAVELLFRPANDFVRSFLENQRLELELASLQLTDIWRFIPQQAAHNTGKPLPCNATCREALEALLDGPATVSCHGEHRQLDGTLLFNAIAAYKKQ
ncbi:ABC transporter ATP-binding protein [Chitinophaga sp. Mgbs1]|uniref:ABC transporter ATP-binding protein n=1 Tax=Chitinophaga solisilvae TaxID=1233460 RepID=A0A3S1CYZ2_9BACT|nr:ABC transporter ATP-binding protein [Chitinophaga solisilvae]